MQRLKNISNDIARANAQLQYVLEKIAETEQGSFNDERVALIREARTALKRAWSLIRKAGES